MEESEKSRLSYGFNVRNIEIGSYFDVVGQKTEVQYGPMGMFLIAFVFGLGILAWMLIQAVKASRRSDLA